MYLFIKGAQFVVNKSYLLKPFIINEVSVLSSYLFE